MDLEYIKSFNSEDSVIARYEKMFDDLMNKK